ncbi:MAG: alanine--tRNA ligase [Candidatus Cloacimonetes bacterium]|nr:alanine--tRNA ligase [Candidatus Cloacimonadota bacterium]
MISSADIRKQFIDYFTDKGHIFIRSSPVVPIDDPTLLFTNAGMNQFKDIFLGQKQTDIKSAVNSQKCLRAGGKHNDLDEVGKDGYHQTFFEMLGNWSFGDYYKKEAIQMAWELLTAVWRLPKDRLYATVYDSDDEAFELWKSETDIDPSHISRHGDKDNFWEMGETGPCGPCSEIHIDRGEGFCNLRDDEGHKCAVNGDCHRYMELWNLVFMQYNRAEDRSLKPLHSKFVDTGAGFERICQVLQGKSSNYDTDIFQPLIIEIAKLTGKPYTEEDGISHRVIADHVRALTFAIADGGIPSNEGRGYVLRRILRRAARFGRNLDMKNPFLYKLVDTIVLQMGDFFSEIKLRADFIKTIIQSEETRFNQTLDNGLNLFNDLIRTLKDDCISGKDAFTLFDTYGFPLDLTKILAEEKKLSVDEQTFFEEMKKQKQRARDASNFKMQNEEVEWIVYKEGKKTEFVGYQLETCEVNMVKFAIFETPPPALTASLLTADQTEESLSSSHSHQIVRFVLDQTPFYAESGGQVADKGLVYNDGTEIFVFNVQKEGDQFIHWGRINKGVIEDKPYTAQISKKVRTFITAHHTATHLLHAALRKILGEHVSQRGSLVNEMGIRFDFTHFNAMTTEEIHYTESLVNQEIRKCSAVNIETKSLDDAKKEGATALFGEKYGEEVRVVTAGDFSKELCGGTHIKNTGQIGFFKIISEASIASGVRRIEAIAGEIAEKHVMLNDHILGSVYTCLTANRNNIIEKIDKLQQEIKTQQEMINTLTTQKSSGLIDDLIRKKTQIATGVDLVCQRVQVSTLDQLKTMGDLLKTKMQNGVGVLVAEIEGNVSILVVVSAELTKALSAGKIVQALSTIIEGKGGGRPDMAMGGGKAVEKVEKMFSSVPELISAMIEAKS